MKLIDTGQSFSEAHPILGVLTSPILYFSAFVIAIGCLIIALMMRNKEVSNRYVPIYVLYLLFSITILLYLLVALFLQQFRLSYDPKYTYHGDAKIINVSPKDEKGKREITIKCDGTIRLLNLSDYNTDNVKKGDDVTLEIEYDKNVLADRFFEKDSKKPKKYVSIKEMDNLSKAKILKGDLNGKPSRLNSVNQ